MGKKVTLEQIANELNMSKTTISKAINNCPGITPHTKSVVMNAACSYGYSAARPVSGNVAVVLPSVPEYFWGNMRKKIYGYTKISDIKCTFYVYNNIHDKDDALNCINKALSDNISVLILAAPASVEIRQRLESVASDILVILIEEFLDVKNAFFVGEDSFSQGYKLGGRYRVDFPSSKQFALLHCSDSHTENMRIKGFSEAVAADGIMFVDMRSNTSSRTQSAEFARELVALKELPDCIFCPSGNARMAALAVKKLKSDKEVHCIGFDLNTKNDNTVYNGILTHVVIQDIELQVKKAVECANTFLKSRTFPENKNIYVDNVYYVFK